MHSIKPPLPEESAKTGADFEVLRNSLLFLVIAFLAGIVEDGNNSAIPVYGMGIGLIAHHAGLLVTVFNLGNLLAQIPIGYVADRLTTRQLHNATLGLVAALVVGLAALPLIGDSFLLWAAVFMIGGTGGSMYTIALIQAGKSYPTGQIGEVITLMASAATIGAMLGPVMSGYALQLSTTFGLTASIGGLSLFIGLILLMSGDRLLKESSGG